MKFIFNLTDKRTKIRFYTVDKIGKKTDIHILSPTDKKCYKDGEWVKYSHRQKDIKLFMEIEEI